MNREFQNDELFHYGVLGMKWGVRRYQNADGTLTDAGKKRFNSLASKRDSTSVRLERVENKKAKITARYNTVGHAKQEARTAKLTAKRNALEPKVSKLQRKILRGKEPGFFGKHTLNKAYKLDKAIARSSKAKVKFDERISKLDVKASRLQKRIDRYDKTLNKLDPNHELAGKRFIESLKLDTNANGYDYTKRNLKGTAQDILNDKQSTRRQVEWANNVNRYVI